MGESATKTFGILTSGGDCPGLNAAIRAVAKTAVGKYGMQILGISNGYRGLVDGDITPLKMEDFSGILTIGGTILGTSREKPLKPPKDSTLDFNVENVQKIKENYKKHNMDCVVVLGGNGSQKTANLLQESGLNVVSIPKTIDNDLYGTDTSIGFHTAVDITTEAVDRLHSTAHSHNRVMILEVMGHKAGWLALYAGVAGGGDVIIIPEIPYRIDSIVKHLDNRSKGGKAFSIVVVAEGAISVEEAEMSPKKLKKIRKESNYPTVGYAIAKEIEDKIEMDVRVSVLGYQQRGGTPSAYDRIIATQLGTAAAELLYKGDYGKMVALRNNEVIPVPLQQIAGKLKTVPSDHELIRNARRVGTCICE